MQSAEKSPEARLKELLLEDELALLRELEKRCEELHFRVGDDPALRTSVSRVIIDTLRQAGVEDYDRLAGVLAPLVLQSLRQEIRNSRDMMVDALYPITGRLVAAAVKNAFSDLMQRLDDRLNDTLSFDRLKIRAQALVTRQSAAELMLQKFPPFELDELLVIQRGSGLLISHWVRSQKEGGGVDGDLIGGLLSAIMSFTRDAFGDSEQGELNNLEFGGATLYIRASPVVVIAIKAHGTPPKYFGVGLDALFVDYVEKWGKAVADADHELDEMGRGELVADLHRRIGELLAGRKKKPLSAYRNAFIVLGLVLLLGLGWGVKGWLEAREVLRIEATARSTAAAQPALNGYPITLRYLREAGALRVTGLVPDPQAQAGLSSALAAALPDAEIDFTGLGMLPDLPSVEQPSAEFLATQRLERWARRSAIYFVRDTTPRDLAQVGQRLDTAARLLLATPPEVQLRVAGYADASGAEELNRLVSERRARWVASELAARGVSAERLVLVAQSADQNLLAEIGEGSESRRVEFEVAYERK